MINISSRENVGGGGVFFVERRFLFARKIRKRASYQSRRSRQQIC